MDGGIAESRALIVESGAKSQERVEVGLRKPEARLRLEGYRLV